MWPKMLFFFAWQQCCELNLKKSLLSILTEIKLKQFAKSFAITSTVRLNIVEEMTRLLTVPASA